MAQVVVDSGNLEQVLAHSAGEEVESAQPAPPTRQEKAAAKAEAKAVTAKAAEVVKEDKPAPAAETADQDDADDEEGEDGLTTRQKRELSAKMLKAIGKKHRQVKEAEEFAADQIRLVREAERRASALEAELTQVKAKIEPPKEAVEPKRDAFQSEADYVDAKIQWGIDQGIAKREADRAEADRQNRVASQLARAAELVPDFAKVTEASLNWPGAVAQYLRDSDLFAELGYYFASAPAELERISKLNPHKQLVEVGKIESRLSPFGSKAASSDSPKAADKSADGEGDKPAPSTRDTGFSPSKARGDAPVIKPLSGEGQAIEPDPAHMSTREMIQAYQKGKGTNLTARRRH